MAHPPRMRRVSQRRIHAVGSYGMLNYGDDLFIDTLKRTGGDIWPDANVKTFVPLSSLLYASGGRAAGALRLMTAAVGALWADTIAMCGGSIMEDVRGVGRFRAKLLRWRNLEALGVSVGPFRDSEAEKRVRYLIQHLCRFIVRDQASVTRAMQAFPGGRHPVVGGDLAALNPTVRPAITSTTRSIAVCPSAASRIPAELLCRQVIQGLRQVEHARSYRPRLKLLALSRAPTADDLPLCRTLQYTLFQHGHDATIVPYGKISVLEMTRELAESSMVWSQRLHGAIVSYLCDVPFLLVGHHAKCVDFANDIGLDGRTIVESHDGWDEGIRALLATGRRSRMTADAYRSRAREAYFAWGSDLGRSSRRVDAAEVPRAAWNPRIR